MEVGSEMCMDKNSKNYRKIYFSCLEYLHVFYIYFTCKNDANNAQKHNFLCIEPK